MVTIYPPGTVSACNGGQLELACTTSGNYHEWIFYVVPSNGTNISEYARLLTTNGDQRSNLTVNSIMFTFHRKSMRGSLPLITSLTIDPISSGYLGAEVICTDKESSNSSSVFLNIINGSDFLQQGIVPTQLY